MPAVNTPCVLPNTITFYSDDEASLTQRFCIYNPFPFDILYKVDNARPQKYSVSNRQGVVSGRQKLCLELTCLNPEESHNDGIQVRFFKWSRPYHGHKQKAQHYIGFREVRVSTQAERPESVSEDVGDVTEAGSQISGSCLNKSAIHSGSSAFRDSVHSGHDTTAQTGHRIIIVTNIIAAVLLLLMGFVLNHASEEWFVQNVMQGIKPQTLAIVSYTLAVVVIVKLLTFR